MKNKKKCLLPPLQSIFSKIKRMVILAIIWLYLLTQTGSYVGTNCCIAFCVAVVINVDNQDAHCNSSGSSSPRPGYIVHMLNNRRLMPLIMLPLTKVCINSLKNNLSQTPVPDYPSFYLFAPSQFLFSKNLNRLLKYSATRFLRR